MMNYWIFLVIVFVVLYTAAYVIFQYNDNDDQNCNSKEEHMEGALVQLMTKGPQDVYLTSDIEKYVPEYNRPYYWQDSYNTCNTCNTYNRYNRYGNVFRNTKNVNPWYGYTPFAWGNGTRYPKLGNGWPYYQYIYNWYADTY